MNQKQKLGYMVLGAWIMAVGIIIGQVITPNIEAQNNGVFDEIQCSELKAVDKSGKVFAHLVAEEDGQGLLIFDKAGAPALQLGVEGDERGLIVGDKTENPAFQIVALDELNEIALFGKAGKEVIVLQATEEHGTSIQIKNRTGNIKWNAPKKEIINYDSAS